MTDLGTDLVSVQITAGGTEVAADAVISIEIRHAYDRIPRAVLELADGDVSEQDFALSSSDSFAPGTEVTVSAGHGLRPEPLMTGIVTGHRVVVRPGSGTRLIVELADKAVALTQGRRSRTFLDSTDSAVAEDILRGAALVSDVSATPITFPQMVQHQTSDWDFLVMRAEARGHQVNVQDGIVTIAPPPAPGAPVASIAFGQDVISADLGLMAGPALAGADHSAWSPADQAVTQGTAEDDRRVLPGDTAGAALAGEARADRTHSGALEAGEPDELATGRIARSRRTSVRGQVEVYGQAALKPGALVMLTGFGTRLSGLAEISGTVHRIRAGSWTCEMQMGREDRPHLARFGSAAAGAEASPVPVATGLQIGLLLALEGDPAGEDRLQLRLPLEGGGEATLWARQALMDAGDSRSTAFRPEIGDEVVVGFLSGDPRHPVILGALHSSARPSPLPGSDDNHEKAIITRSGMKLTFDDDAVSTALETPSGSMVRLDDREGEVRLEDGNGNAIVLSARGIAIESGAALTLTARTDLKIEGSNAEVSAVGQATLKGSAGAEVSSGGVSVLKGALVQIN